MSKSDQPALSSGGRGRGRPSIGPSVPVRLSDEEKSFAAILGEGVVARGARRAINAAGRLGPEAAKRLAGLDETEDRAAEKRGRGRPKIGKPVPVRLTDPEQVIADDLGTSENGKVVTAEGVRRALRACSRLGIEATMRLVD
jgi:hypothetical protein